jgi:hypothetical protein
MTSPTVTVWMGRKSTPGQPAASRPLNQLQRIAVDDRQQGRDAAVLMQTLSVATDADQLLIAVEPDLSMMLPYADWSNVHRQTKAMLARVPDDLGPGARIEADRDVSIARGIERRVARNHRQLLVVGSSRRAASGAAG